MACKSKLRSPYDSHPILSCDKSDNYHEFHHDKVYGVEWRKDNEGIGVTALRPTHPKIYEHRPEPMERVSVVLDA